MVSIKADVEEVQKALSGTTKSLKSIQRQIVGTVARKTRDVIKAAIKSSDLHKRTGELLKAYRYKVRKDGSEANVFPKALSGDTIFPKAMTLSYGHDGPTARASQWSIKPRCFVQSGDTYIQSGSYQQDIEKVVQKELDKYWG